MKLLRLAVIICAAALTAFGQNAAVMPRVGEPFLDLNGKPLAGGKIWSYLAGTETLSATYSDAAGTANTNPVTLDSAGRASIWLGPRAYKIVVKTAAGVTLYTVDNVFASGISPDVTVASGATFTLAAGSSTNIQTDLLPDATATRSLGSASKLWLKAWLGSLSLTGHALPTVAGTYDLGSSTMFWRKIYASEIYGASIMLQGGSGAYSFAPVVDATNSYVTFSDSAGNPLLRWSRLESGVSTNHIKAYMNFVPLVANALALGAAGNEWRTGYFATEVYSPSFAIKHSGGTMWRLGQNGASKVRLLNESGFPVFEFDTGAGEGAFAYSPVPYAGYSVTLGSLAHPWPEVHAVSVVFANPGAPTVNCAASLDGTAYYDGTADKLYICYGGVAKPH